MKIPHLLKCLSVFVLAQILVVTATPLPLSRSPTLIPRAPPQPSHQAQGAGGGHIDHGTAPHAGNESSEPARTVTLPKDLFEHMEPPLHKDLTIDIPPSGDEEALASFVTFVKVLRACKDRHQVNLWLNGVSKSHPWLILPTPTIHDFKMAPNAERSMLLKAVECHNSHGKKKLILPQQITMNPPISTKMGFPSNELVYFYVPRPAEFLHVGAYRPPSPTRVAFINVVDIIRASDSFNWKFYRPLVEQLKKDYGLDIPSQRTNYVIPPDKLIPRLRRAILKNNELLLPFRSKSPDEPLNPSAIHEPTPEQIDHASVPEARKHLWEPAGTVPIPKELFKQMQPPLDDLTIDIPPPGDEDALDSFTTVVKVVRGCKDRRQLESWLTKHGFPKLDRKTKAFEMASGEESSTLLKAVECHNSHGEKKMILPRRTRIPDSILEKIDFKHEEPLFLHVPLPVTFHYVEDRDHLSQHPGLAEYTAFMNVIQIMRASK
ncbi:hypothetical protein H0H93_001086, partial [Arthromyces matolae]